MSKSFAKQIGIELIPSTAPADPANGDMYNDSVSGLFYLYQNGAWVSIQPNNIQTVFDNLTTYVDGSTNTFHPTYTPNDSVIIVLNGLIKYVNTDFTGTSNIQFAYAPALGSTLVAIYSTLSALTQNDLGTGNGSTTSYLIKKADDILVAVSGVVQLPGVEYDSHSGYLNFLAGYTPEANQRILAITNGIGASGQQALTGSGTTWTFATATTRTGAYVVCVNGRIMDKGIDYTVAGSTVTFGTALVTGQVPYMIQFNS